MANPTLETTYVHPDRVMLGECTRAEIRTALARGDLQAAIVPIGATEQHNEHLTLNFDIVMSTFMAQQAALELFPKVVVAPGCPIGYSPYHMARKGTLTLRKETLRAYLFDVLESLRTHGIGTVLVLNGHGGNTNLLKDVLPAWRAQLDMTVEEISYWTGINEAERAQILTGYSELAAGCLDTVAQQTALNHASEEETSLMLATFPHRVRSFTMSAYDAAGLDYAETLSDRVRKYLEPFSADGWPAAGTNPENPRDRARQENALLATAAKGGRLIAIHLRFICETLDRLISVRAQKSNEESEV